MYSQHKVKVPVPYVKEVKAQFVLNIKVVIKMDEIPTDLVINWDQTGIHYIPCRLMDNGEERLKKVAIIAVDEKRQVTVVFAGSLIGDFLPPQLIYEGTTKQCLPGVKFPSDQNITHSHNHWSNQSKMKAYIEKILLSYSNRKRRELKLHPDYQALVIFDKFNGQGTESLLNFLEDTHIHVHVVMVPTKLH